ncbi:tyrosine-protein kinase SRK2-like isoform X1 [Eriocheir sinensis]|uniref:tyrosine-protein kinase SRK2-like isoform X1 n=1 Tax=Eriocheir sinensis TaxID=95602 RepID=UPI0021C7C212|nr:tyrosine-protein kinase SRK2-like isoform X1 [Eriocheir sinensis]XP_050731676.1 tyrosine-protein kinase SRK2-like isoform X1 [Eriocheir sinensis]
MGQNLCCPKKGHPAPPHQPFMDLGKTDGAAMTPPHGTTGGGPNPRYYPEPARGGGRAPYNSQQHGVDVIRSNSSQGLPAHGWTQHSSHMRMRKESEPGTPSTPSRGGRIVLAMYKFQGRSNGELSFEKGDRMEIINDADADWWLARHLTRHIEGYIPKNYVASASSLECQDWYFGKIARKEAEKLLMARGNLRGTFLIRMSEQTSHGYSLSIRVSGDWDTNKGEHVKHYRIKVTDGGSYFITSTQAFRTLNDLVDAYKKNNYGLACLLQYPCPRPQPQKWDLSRETKDQWEIDRTALTMIKKLGQGSFGEVWYGMWNNSNEVAIKTLKQGAMSPEAFLEEARIMKQLRHRNILVLYAVCTKEEPILIVTEYMCNGALLDLLRNEGERTLKLNDLIYVATQVAAGMAYLESLLLLHRDLAARNVLVGESLLCKVADFGLARIVEGEDYCPSTCNKFPVKWTAPEAMLYNRFTIKSDVWSFGVLLMEVITYGANPYPGMNNREVIERVQAGYRMAKPPRCPDELYKAMLHCWNKDPDMRPTFDFLHHFFDDFQVSSEVPYRDIHD